MWFQGRSHNSAADEHTGFVGLLWLYRAFFLPLRLVPLTGHCIVFSQGFISP
jgi:hypothetical protein